MLYAVHVLVDAARAQDWESWMRQDHIPEVIDTGDLLARALADGVAFVPGTEAFVDGRGANAMRLNFSGVSEERIIEGIRRIGRLADRMLGLYETIANTAELPLPEATLRRADGEDGG